LPVLDIPPGYSHACLLQWAFRERDGV
jgi:hypothetical protein